MNKLTRAEKGKGRPSGFTLIEILVVIGIIAVLAAIVIIAINPARQFAQARQSQRTSNVNAILNAIGQRMADNRGIFNGTLNGVTCPALTVAPLQIASGGGAGTIDLGTCLTPTYIPALPFDPGSDTALAGQWTSSTNYNTQYQVSQDLAGRVTVSAMTSEGALGNPPAVSVTR